MTRWMTAIGLSLISQTAFAHFVFVVPQKDGKTVEVVLSETLEADDAVTVEKIAGLKLTVRAADGKESPLALEAGKHALTGKLGDTKPSLAYGSVAYGVMKRGEGKPFLLEYLPKAIWPGTTEASLGKTATLEIVPTFKDGKTVLRVLAAGEPVAEAEITVIAGDKKEKVKTDKEGNTTALELRGPTGAWVKHTTAKAGTLGNEKYDEIRSYATVTFDATAIPPLRKGVSSFGAVASDGYVYVYGGHSGHRHDYDATTALGTFDRFKLDGGTAWESLPGGTAMQGLALVEHKGTIIRIGGMTPKNAPGDSGDLVSITDVSKYDIAKKTWSKLPDLPAPRSSHDAWVVGDKLYVLGGWSMNGKDAKSTWHDTALVLDLAATTPAWKTIPQPFQRRALTVAALSTKIYVVGGLDAQAKAHPKVDVLDTVSGVWSNGPELPSISGFSPAAAVADGKLYVSTNDGKLHVLEGSEWKPAGKTQTARMVHRLIPDGPRLLMIGGGGAGGNWAEVESVTVQTTK